MQPIPLDNLLKPFTHIISQWAHTGECTERTWVVLGGEKDSNTHEARMDFISSPTPQEAFSVVKQWQMVTRLWTHLLDVT